jgi:hypothetical protein
MVMLSQITISFREASISEHRAFAYRKAMGLLAEIQNGVERGEIPDAVSLDRMADVTPNFTLTAVADQGGNPLAPDHPMSGNLRRDGQWLWSRRVEVDIPPKQAALRYVRIAVSRLRDEGGFEVMAAVGGVLTLPASPGVATQHYDVYVLAAG